MQAFMTFLALGLWWLAAASNSVGMYAIDDPRIGPMQQQSLNSNPTNQPRNLSSSPFLTGNSVLSVTNQLENSLNLLLTLAINFVIKCRSCTTTSVFRHSSGWTHYGLLIREFVHEKNCGKQDVFRQGPHRRTRV